MTRTRRVVLTWREAGILAALLAGLFVLIQLLPVGAPRTNPPLVAEPPWDSPRTRELFERACADCHSNRTRWPWYAHVAPVSWLVAHDVAEGREHLNVSEWHREQEDAAEAAEEVRAGRMPYRGYALTHSEARLGPEEKRALIAGLAATFGDEGEDDASGHDDH